MGVAAGIFFLIEPEPAPRPAVTTEKPDVSSEKEEEHNVTDAHFDFLSFEHFAKGFAVEVERERLDDGIIDVYYTIPSEEYDYLVEEYCQALEEYEGFDSCDFYSEMNFTGFIYPVLGEEYEFVVTYDGEKSNPCHLCTSVYDADGQRIVNVAFSEKLRDVGKNYVTAMASSSSVTAPSFADFADAAPEYSTQDNMNIYKYEVPQSVNKYVVEDYADNLITYYPYTQSGYKEIDDVSWRWFTYSGNDDDIYAYNGILSDGTKMNKCHIYICSYVEDSNIHVKIGVSEDICIEEFAE